MRPSLLDGEQGFGSRWLRLVSRWPVHFIPSSAIGQVAPLDVAELGEAIANLCSLNKRNDLRGVDLGGPLNLSMLEYLARLRAEKNSTPAHVLSIPSWIIRAVSHLFDLLHFSPLSFGHLELMTLDNVPANNQLAQLLGREPREIGADPIAIRTEKNTIKNKPDFPAAST